MVSSRLHRILTLPQSKYYLLHLSLHQAWVSVYTCKAGCDIQQVVQLRLFPFLSSLIAWLVHLRGLADLVQMWYEWGVFVFCKRQFR